MVTWYAPLCRGRVNSNAAAIDAQPPPTMATFIGFRVPNRRLPAFAGAPCTRCQGLPAYSMLHVRVVLERPPNSPAWEAGAVWRHAADGRDMKDKILSYRSG